MSALTIPQRPARKFLGEEFSLTTWEQLQPFYENLKNRSIQSVGDLRQWFLDKSELESYLSENFAWRYIRMTCDTASEQYQQEFNDFVENFQPYLSAYGNELDKKAFESPYLSELKDTGFDVALRSMKKAIEIFREENIPLQTQIQTEQAKYGAIVGAMTVNVNGEEVTLPKASDFLQSTDRNLREQVWLKIQTRRLEDKAALDESTYSGGKNGVNHPFIWYREFDGGRSFYTGGGHTDESFVEPLFVQHLLGGIEYAMGRKSVKKPM